MLAGDDYMGRSPLDASDRTERNRVENKFPVEPAAPAGAELFEEVVLKNKKAVFAVAYAKLRNAHDAEDVMQEVFIEAHRKFQDLRNPNGIGAWLHKATIYRCGDHFRKSSRRRKRESAFAETAPNNPSTGAYARDGVGDAALEAIGRLPEKYRQILMLKHFAGLSYAEISKTTGLSESIIGNRLQAARKKLREKLTKMGEGVDRK
jgi:RNA polymerase sigma-70 factor (ECF subfamily)